MKPRIVLSGVNFIEGGPLSLFTDALDELSQHFGDRYTIVALVHRSSLFAIGQVEFLEFPDVKRSWLRRLWFEYVTCKRLSRKLDATLWLAMHDITPRVTAKVRAVYCHNPAPFYQLSFREAMLDRTFALFRLLYKFLYGFGIRKNDWVIVQQDWLRKEFQHRYGVKRVVVAHPSMPSAISRSTSDSAAEVPGVKAFFYPALPRTFKNIQTVLLAAELLEAQLPDASFELWLTIAGDENRYAAELRTRFGQLRSVRWMGRMPRERVMELYGLADCLLFPSRLETWGMPISEWKPTGKPMIVSDLPYAHETVGTYAQVQFVAPDDAHAFANAMRDMLSGSPRTTPAVAASIASPFADNWTVLFRMLLGEDDCSDASILPEKAEGHACCR